jgi:hypothetical protein
VNLRRKKELFSGNLVDSCFCRRNDTTCFKILFPKKQVNLFSVSLPIQIHTWRGWKYWMMCKSLLKILSFFKKEVARGGGSEPGASRFNLFSHFHHLTIVPQRLPPKNYLLLNVSRPM